MTTGVPRKGDRYRSKRRLAVTGVITFGAPFTGGFEGTLPEGETVIVSDEPPASASGVYLQPERYAAFERLLVPERDLRADVYDSYAIAVSFEELARDFDLVAHAT